MYTIDKLKSWGGGDRLFFQKVKIRWGNIEMLPCLVVRNFVYARNQDPMEEGGTT